MQATNTFLKVHYLIIGSGHVARHLSHYFNLLQIPFASWDRAQDPHLLRSKVAEATHILLAISDDALAGFYRKHLEGHDKVVVHFSGSRTVPGMIAAHPLMTFGPGLYDLQLYQRVHFTITGSDSIEKVLPGLSNPFSILPEDKKALYHAWCVMGGNFVTLLTAKMIHALHDMGIPSESATLYSEKILANAILLKEAALTGPLARKDVDTVAANLKALSGSEEEKIYQAFLATYWPEYPRK
ncbi:hypothetical protein D3C72_846050 [compost metagenome]